MTATENVETDVTDVAVETAEEVTVTEPTSDDAPVETVE